MLLFSIQMRLPSLDVICESPISSALSSLKHPTLRRFPRTSLYKISPVERGNTKILGKPSSHECSWKQFGHQLATDLMSGGSVNCYKKKGSEKEKPAGPELSGEKPSKSPC